MGKVGSKTVVKSLKKNNNIAALHVHFISSGGIAWAKNFYNKQLGIKNAFINHLEVGSALHKRINNFDTKWKIITLVRDPVAKNVSQYFNWLNLFNKNLHNYSLDILQKNFILNFSEKTKLGNIPLTWFDQELFANFNIDVFSVPFPKDKGYKVYTGEKADVLVIRLENLDTCFEEAINIFMGIEYVSLNNENDGAETEFGNWYARFKNEVCIPESYLSHMYSSKYANHFYTEKEIEEFSASWRKGCEIS